MAEYLLGFFIKFEIMPSFELPAIADIVEGEEAIPLLFLAMEVVLGRCKVLLC